MSNNQNHKEDWRKVMLTQYSIFGTIAGLEVASLSIYSALAGNAFILVEKILFTIVAVFLFVEVGMILWMINQERKVAWHEATGEGDDMLSFRTNETFFRSGLIIVMNMTWIMILLLFVVHIWWRAI